MLNSDDAKEIESSIRMLNFAHCVAVCVSSAPALQLLSEIAFGHRTNSLLSLFLSCSLKRFGANIKSSERERQRQR